MNRGKTVFAQLHYSRLLVLTHTGDAYGECLVSIVLQAAQPTQKTGFVDRRAALR